MDEFLLLGTLLLVIISGVVGFSVVLKDVSTFKEDAASGIEASFVL